MYLIAYVFSFIHFHTPFYLSGSSWQFVSNRNSLDEVKNCVCLMQCVCWVQSLPALYLTNTENTLERHTQPQVPSSVQFVSLYGTNWKWDTSLEQTSQSPIITPLPAPYHRICYSGVNHTELSCLHTHHLCLSDLWGVCVCVCSLWMWGEHTLSPTLTWISTHNERAKHLHTLRTEYTDVQE